MRAVWQEGNLFPADVRYAPDWKLHYNELMNSGNWKRILSDREIKANWRERGIVMGARISDSELLYSGPASDLFRRNAVNGKPLEYLLGLAWDSFVRKKLMRRDFKKRSPPGGLFVFRCRLHGGNHVLAQAGLQRTEPLLLLVPLERLLAEYPCKIVSKASGFIRCVAIVRKRLRQRGKRLLDHVIGIYIGEMRLEIRKHHRTIPRHELRPTCIVRIGRYFAQ